MAPNRTNVNRELASLYDNKLGKKWESKGTRRGTKQRSPGDHIRSKATNLQVRNNTRDHNPEDSSASGVEALRTGRPALGSQPASAQASLPSGSSHTASLSSSSDSAPPSISELEQSPRKLTPTLPAGYGNPSVSDEDSITVSDQESSTSMAAPRNRAPRGTRGIADNDTEEALRWADVQSDIRLTETMADEINDTQREINRTTVEFKKREKGSNPPTSNELEALDKLTRKVQTLNDKLSKHLSALQEKLDILKGLQAANEAPAAEPLRRGGSSRDGAKTFDPDGPSNSPAPPSSVDREKSNLKRVSRESRGSLPPKDSAIKQESVGAQASTSNSGSATNAKGKTEFAIGDEVAWRPKKETHQDWIQCNVIRVIGEGKSRRYDVQDPEPDEKTLVGAIHRTSASSMVAIPPPGSVLPDLAPKTAVLARYPDTTTFYTAEVIRMNGGNVILRFEGEDEPNQTTEVERRLVLDYPRQ